MTYKTDIAKALRRAGLSRLVESPMLRRAARVPAPDVKPSDNRTPAQGPIDLGVNGPRLSVIVPAYNVQQYLATCLDSILSQSYSNLDVIVVNDGSSDQTGSIADEYARRHKRLRVIHKRNAGLGAARNTGLEYSHDDYVTFVDSDDIVPPDAYQTAMMSLLNTGSDLTVGSVERFDSRNKWLPFWVHLAHDKYRPSISGLDFPPIMWDVFAWNKVFKRSTWDRVVGQFPEGTLYEDQECTAKLYVGGVKIDVLDKVVYRWRLRDDNTSITQQKTDIDDLNQRLNVMKAVEDIICRTDDNYRDYWYSKTLGEDLYYYLREIPRATDEFFEILSEQTSRLWNSASYSSIAGISPARRILCYFVTTKTREEVERLLIQLDRTKEAYDVNFAGGKLTFQIPDETGRPFPIPTHLTEVVPEHLTADVRIDEYEPRANGDVVFRGFGKVQNFGAATGFSADLYNSVSEQIVATLEVEHANRGNDFRISDSLHSYEDSGFELTIPHYVIDEIARDSDSTQSDQLTLRIHIHIGELSWTVSNVKRDLHSYAGYPHASEFTTRSNRVAVQGDPRVRTDLLVLSPKIAASHIAVKDGQLNVTADPDALSAAFGVETPVGTYVIVQSRTGELAKGNFKFTEGRAHASIPLLGFDPTPSLCLDKYDLYIGSPNGMRTSIAIRQDQASRDRDVDLQVGITGFGYAVLEQPIQAASVHEARIDNDSGTFTVTGTFTLNAKVARNVAPTLALVGNERNLYPQNLQVDFVNREYTAEFSLNDAVDLPANRPESAAHFIFQLLLASGKSHPASSWVATNVSFERTLPQRRICGDHLLTLDPVGNSRSLRIKISAPLSPKTELGSWNEALNSRTFISPTRSIRTNTVLFESFAGHSVGDSPLALNNEIARRFPSATRLWTVRDSTSNVPKGAKPVIFRSAEWFDAVSSAAVLVNNNNFPHYFSRHPDQTYVQTWHGTPLKKIGNHVPPANLSLNYRALMKMEAEQHWSFLLAQSPWAAETLRSAFGYSGSMIVEGYPRNDGLIDSHKSSSRRNEVRNLLGISETQRAVLYAPTWRDNLKDRSGHYSMVDFLDVNKTSAQLGPSSKVLYRGHSNSLFGKRVSFTEGVLDVSAHPDINDLILASDVLVTDYSSIMFDYVVTGKPIAFLCPDLDSYQEKVRGFYLDFERVAPGEILRSREAVVELLNSSSMFTAPSTERYIEFTRKFAGLDDGAASKRVVSKLEGLFN